MSDLETYLEERRVELEQIIAERRWAEMDELFLEMEREGYSQYEAELSEMLTDEDVADYKKWDESVNGTTADQMDDDSDKEVANTREALQQGEDEKGSWRE